MAILVCGSLAFDTIMVFPDQFRKHILPDRLHMLNVSFMVPDMRREYGGTAGNIGYNLRLLDEAPLVMATVGHDFDPYARRMRELGMDTRHVRVVDNQFTAQAFITTDMDDNQITAFHPGAMSFAHLNKVAEAAQVRVAIVSPDGRQGMVEHARDLAAAKIPYIFDPGQGLPMFDGKDLLAMMDGAAALAVNDYEAGVVEHKCGMPMTELATRVPAIVITRGPDGSVIHANGERHEIPAVRAESIVDPTGCGDAYRAGLLYGRARGWDWRRCGQLASVMGSIKIGHRGGQNHRPSPDEIATRLRDNFSQAL